MGCCRDYFKGERVLTVAGTLGAVVILFLAVYGCAAAVRAVTLRLLGWPKEARGVWVLPLSGHCEDAEYRVRCVAAACRFGVLPARVVYVLNVGADAETLAVAEKTCGVVAGVQFFEQEDASIKEIFS